MDNNTAINMKTMIENGSCFLGIEFGSTRVKAVLIGEDTKPIASGAFDWENSFNGGIWYYPQEQIIEALQGCYRSLKEDILEKYGAELTSAAGMGISGMMHGYMPFDSEGRLLVPFRTWRNTITSQAAEELSRELGFNIPQRWSIAHLYQAVLNGEKHIGRIAYINTLAGYVHFLLTGRREVGIGEASGIFPIRDKDYNSDFIAVTERLLSDKGFDKPLRELLPRVRLAGSTGAVLTDAGAALLDPTGKLRAGVPMCPPEGDAGTGMTATNSVRRRTGNISAGTSIFSMLVLDRPLKSMHADIDIVTTPDGADVAMVHCNNCCSEIDMWVKMFGEFSELAGARLDKSALYELLYRNAMTAPADCGGAVCCNFISGEPVAGVENGRPLYSREPDRAVTLGGFFRAQLYSTFAALTLGNEVLFREEGVSAERFNGHGGLFKVSGAASQLMADALGVPVAVLTTAGEGGAWGMALLAQYMVCGGGQALADWLDEKVFAGARAEISQPDRNGAEGFAAFMKNYERLLVSERLSDKE